MRFYTAHLRPASAPILVREGFSWHAAVFGPFWLAVNGAWIAAALSLGLNAGIVLVPDPLHSVAGLILAWAHGVFGRDLLRWTLALRGFAQGPVLAARNEDAAYARLLTARPELAESAAA